MKKFWLWLYILPVTPVIIYSCRLNEKETKNDFISVVSLIRADVAHVDTSLYSIVKTITYDSLHTDTQYIPREKFKDEAKDFLEIPDLADQKVAKNYKSDPPRYDELLGRAIFKYTPIHPEKEEVKSQELLATPVPGADARINNVIILREISNRDSFLQKKMLWQMNRSFQIITTTQKPGKPELTTITRVTWNEQPDP
jgi:hypothetical protein